MDYYICTTCGTQYSFTNESPAFCEICNEERQYVRPSGQTWTTLRTMQLNKKIINEVLYQEEGIHSITTKPKFGLGQTAYLVQSNNFNLLWDCITYIDDSTIETINQNGGIDAIALSHPHYYSSQVEWAETFDVPIYIHEDDQEWVMRPSERITFWSGEVLELSEEFSLHRLGGHFKGGAVLHWKNGNDGKGILFTGDIIQIVADQKWVSFMYSYPNLIPLPVSKVQNIAEYTNKIAFNRIYSAFNKVIKEDAHISVQESAKRYIKAIQGKLFIT
ncbi:MBL fold metallo-hydrolase [Oceanobacillus jeddahense]|uniref:MBL fold metallo-hydrolase n=1 Tax=Oceanobacillus jeddahense TaxID=1462527 RepID=UPI0036441601